MQASDRSMAEIAKQVYHRSVKWKIPLTPINFHILFEYESNNESLVCEVDRIMRVEKQLTVDKSRTLYDRFCKAGEKDELLENVNNEVIKTLKNVLNDVLSTNKEMSDYQENLDGFSGGLTAINDIDGVKNLIEKMVDDTNKMAETSKKFQNKLEEANSYSIALQNQLEEVKKDAYTDGLTQLNNRAAFDAKVADLIENFQQKSEAFSLVIVDIDFFKKFNDKYGHLIGDEVLRVVGSILFKNIKGNDFVARYGGEEFVILFPETEIKGAVIVSNIIREKILRRKITITKTGEELDKITISMGVAKIKPNDDVESLIERADEALYLAKDSGRNNVKTENDLN